MQKMLVTTLVVLIVAVNLNERLVSGNTDFGGSSKSEQVERIKPALEQQQQPQQESNTAELTRLRRHTQTTAGGQIGARPKPDCAKLELFHTYLSSSYPNLSRHLFEWATQASGGLQSDARFLFARTSHIATIIGRLLSEADQLLSSNQQQEQPKQSNNLQSAWLSRVSSNPTYAKLIQHLRRKQLAEAYSNKTGNKSDDLRQQQRQSSQNVALEAAAGSGHVFGRVAHYPRELDSSQSGSAFGAARSVLDKLHTLRARVGEQAGDSPESNKILREPFDEELEANSHNRQGEFKRLI